MERLGIIFGEDKMPGVFITLEGVDLCGKSTQVDRLVTYLRKRGFEVVVSREPGGPPISEKIREILLDPENRAMTALTELLLYEASRAQHTAELIEPALQAGKWVISDRYGDASFAYQGYGRNLGGELVRGLNQLATAGLVPNLTIVLDLPPEEAVQRSKGEGWKADRLERERADFHRRVREGYLKLAQQEPQRVKIVDGRGTVEEIGDRVREVVDNFIREELSEARE